LFVDDAVDRGPRGTVSAGDLAQALAMLAFAEDGGADEIKGAASDMLAFEAGAPHAGADPLDDQIPLKLCNRADDDHDGAAQRAAGVDVFPERDIFDVQSIQLIQHIEEVFHRPGDPVRGPNLDHIEPAAAGVSHHLIEAWALCLGAADPVGVLMDDLLAAPSGHLPEIEQLRFRMLIEG